MKYWRGYLVAAILAAITWALVEFAKAQLDAKMYAEGVKLYRISETRVSARAEENEYTVEIVYAVSGGKKESYVYHIVMENGACTLIEEKAGFA